MKGGGGWRRVGRCIKMNQSLPALHSFEDLPAVEEEGKGGGVEAREIG